MHDISRKKKIFSDRIVANNFTHKREESVFSAIRERDFVTQVYIRIHNIKAYKAVEEEEASLYFDC